MMQRGEGEGGDGEREGRRRGEGLARDGERDWPADLDVKRKRESAMGKSGVDGESEWTAGTSGGGRG